MHNKLAARQSQSSTIAGTHIFGWETISSPSCKNGRAAHAVTLPRLTQADVFRISWLSAVCKQVKMPGSSPSATAKHSGSFPMSACVEIARHFPAELFPSNILFEVACRYYVDFLAIDNSCERKALRMLTKPLSFGQHFPAAFAKCSLQAMDASGKLKGKYLRLACRHRVACTKGTCACASVCVRECVVVGQGNWEFTSSIPVGRSSSTCEILSVKKVPL